MVRISYIKIPSVRVGSIVPTSNIGTGGATPAPPTPITYLTQWKIVGNSEVHTLPYPDGVVLPTGYKRCKYLEFHGTEYIDTGIIPEQGIAVSVDGEFTALDNQDYGLLGCRENAFSSDSLYLLNQRTNHQFVASYGGAVLTQNTSSNPSININKRFSITLDSNKIEIIVDNNTFVLSYTKSIVKGDKSIYIGHVNNSGCSKYYGKIYSISMSLSDALVFNGIPCLDDNDVPCLYDTVSGDTFYNQGTGTFGYEIEPQPTEIWSCGEYNVTDGKYHILVRPLGGSIADIALDEPLRKVNDVADTIEFPSETEGKALVTRNLGSIIMGDRIFSVRDTKYVDYKRFMFFGGVKPVSGNNVVANGLCSGYNMITNNQTYNINADGTATAGIGIDTGGNCYVFDPNYNTASDANAIKVANANTEFIYELATPTTELVDAPQIAEAESYTCEISQGAKAIGWSSFETDSE